jgi:predicted ATPase
MIFLRTIERTGDVEGGSGFPFDLPPVQGFRKLEIRSPVTYFVGENGTGKSTLLEAIGLRAKLECATGRPLEHDPALVPIHPLARSLKLTWMPQTRYGFFLRVEDFFRYARDNRARSASLQPVAVGEEPKLKVRTLRAKEQPDAREEMEPSGQSPGECFLNFLQRRCVPGGLHLIDEPEAVLSPQRQLAFMSLLKSVVAENAQFIIATHSPILLAYPDAQLCCFDGGTIRDVAYNDLAHVDFTRNFLNNPEAYLRDI